MSARHQQTDGCLSSSPSSVRCLLLIIILQKINNFVVDPVSVIRLAPFKRIHQNILSHSWVNAWWNGDRQFNCWIKLGHHRMGLRRKEYRCPLLRYCLRWSVSDSFYCGTAAKSRIRKVLSLMVLLLVLQADAAAHGQTGNHQKCESKLLGLSTRTLNSGSLTV